MQTFVMLHGVNHNMFGKRDPKQYARLPSPKSMIS
jgi:3-dehydroquinate dehydratase-2